MSRLRIASRLARREMRRHPWRTALAVTIMALPVMAVQGGVLLAGASSAADRVAADVQLEGADLRTIPGEVDGLVADGSLPEPTRTQLTYSFDDWLVTPTGELDVVTAIGTVPNSPRVVLTDGRLPRNDQEILANAPALDAAGTRVGDTLELARGNVELQVVGEGVVRDLADRPAIVIGPRTADSDWLTPILGATGANPFAPGNLTMELAWFAPGADGAAAYHAAMNSFVGFGQGTSHGAKVAIVAVTGGAIGILAIVCSVAFTIGSRRRLRSLGLLASSGAAPADLGATVLLEGLFCGGVASVVATGVTYAWWTTIGRSDLVGGLIDSSVAAPPHPMMPLATVGIALLCLLIGPLAAALPARTASRTPVITALAGRRPLPRLRARIPMLGLVAFLAGTAVITRGIYEANRGSSYAGAVYAVAGLAVVFGGVATASTVVVFLGRLGRHTRGAVKLALRGVSRDRTRNAAVVGAAAVALALPVVALTQYAHERHQRSLTQPTYGQVAAHGTPAELPSALTKIDEVVGDEAVAVHVLVPALSASTATTVIAAMSPEDIDAWFGDAAVAERLGRGKAVNPYLVDSDTSQRRDTAMPGDLELYRDGRVPMIEAYGITADDLANHPEMAPLAGRLADVGGVLVSTDVLAEGMVAKLQRSIYVLRDQPVTAAEDAALRAVGAEPPTLEQVRSGVGTGNEEFTPWGTNGWGVAVATNRQATNAAAQVTLAVTAIATVLALLIVLVALALATADGRDDERLFAAVGGAPGLLRRKRTIEAAVLTAGAGLLGVGIGLIPTLAATWASRPVQWHVSPLQPSGYHDLIVPVAELALLVAGVTVAITAAVWAVQALGGLRPRRDLVLTDG